MTRQAGRPSRAAGLRAVRARPRVLPALLLTVLLTLLTACGGEEIAPPRPSGDDSTQRAAGAVTTLRALQRGLAEHDRDRVTALAAPDATSRAAVAAIYANATALDLSRVGFRFVDTDDGTPAARLGRYGLSAWVGTVTVSWRVTGFDRGTAREDTRFSFVQSGGRTKIAAAGGGSGRTPLWLAEPLRVVRGADSLVMVSPRAGEPATTYAARAARAVSDVRKVLPGWHGKLVVEVPSTERVLEQVLDAPRGQYAAIAGVTTTVDGALTAGSPVHVFLNPAVYDGLGPAGSQVVLSHETTHVATDAPFASMPIWLVEGFADYVALAHADVPLGTAARQIFARVRKDGPPKALPTSADLSPSATGLGATYEEAWTVCRYIGRTYGEADLVRLYDAVDTGTAVGAAFRRVLGVDQATVVRGWSADLGRLAQGSTATSGVPLLPRER